MGEDVDHCSILVCVLSTVLVIFNMHCSLDVPLSAFRILLCSICCTWTLIQSMDVNLSGSLVVCETWKSIGAERPGHREPLPESCAQNERSECSDAVQKR